MDDWFYCCQNAGAPIDGGESGGGDPPPGTDPIDSEEAKAADLGECDDPRMCVIGAPVNATTGNMYLQHSDYIADGLSKELSLVRTYNSQNQSDGMFGVGWSTAFEETLTVLDLWRLSVSMGDGRTLHFKRYLTWIDTYVSYLPSNDNSKVTANPDNTYTLVLKSGENHVFNSDGLLISKIDRNGNTTTFTYNASDKLATIASPTGRTLNFYYNANGKVREIYDGVNVTVDSIHEPEILGTVATYLYDTASGSLDQVTYADESQYQYFYTLNSGTSEYYMTEVKDALDNILESHLYDSVGRAYTSEKADGIEKYTLTYLSDTETKIVDALNRETRVVYDNSTGQKAITSITGPYYQQAQSTKYQYYDENLNMNLEVDRLGYEAYYDHDVNGNITNYSSPTITEKLSYNEFSQILTHEDSLGDLTNVYDDYGNLLTSTDSDDATTIFTYDSMGLVETITDPLAHVTEFDYDQFGNINKITNALDQVTAEFIYDVRGRLRQYKDARGYTTFYEYDERNRLKKTIYPDTSFEERIYNLAGQLGKIIDPEGNETEFVEYDSAGRLKKIKDALGQFSTIGYDLMSNISAETDSADRTTEYRYNDMNKLKKIIYPEAEPGAGSLEVEYEYDAVGNLIKSFDTADNVTVYLPDGGGRIVLSTDPALIITGMGYDEHDNLTEVFDANDQQYEFVYDYHDRLKSISRDDGARIRQYTYDLAGNMKQVQDYDGSVTQYEYDDLNRLEVITYPDATTDSFTYYDATSLLKTATNENGTVTLTYYERGWLKTITDVWGKTITYGYDSNGNKTEMTVGGRVTTYVYDALNRLDLMSDDAGNTVDFYYDPLEGTLKTRTINNTLVTEYSYNGLDLLKEIDYRVNSASIANFQYDYSDALNIEEIIDRNGTHIYDYDEKGQLKTATHSTFPAESFDYDAIGNHLNPDETTPPPQGVQYQYDVNGDLEYRVDPVKTPDVNLNIDYKYDALGRLVKRIKGSQWTKYTYDGDDVVLDVKSNGTQVYYGNGPGIDNKLWYEEGSAYPVYFLTDHLGSTRALVSHTGSIISGTLIDYDSFGVPSTQIPTRFQYAGREYDSDTELYYYRARWYDPKARRFISEDPIGLDGGINLYGYVGNNPVRLVDPLGLISCNPDGTVNPTGVPKKPSEGAAAWAQQQFYKGNKDFTLDSGALTDCGGKGKYKCNCFVKHAFKEGGGLKDHQLPKHHCDGKPGEYFATANELADPSLNTNVLKIGTGDVGNIVAWPNKHDSGHTGIVGCDGKIYSATWNDIEQWNRTTIFSFNQIFRYLGRREKIYREYIGGK